MPHSFLIFSQTDYLMRIVAINSHTQQQTVQIQISWLLQKPTDLNLHCLQRQGISRFSRTRVKQPLHNFHLNIRIYYTIITLHFGTDKPLQTVQTQIRCCRLWCLIMQGPHCLPYIQQILDTSRGRRMDYFKFKTSMVSR